MIIRDILNGRVIGLDDALRISKGYNVSLNPAEFFVYKTSKEQKVDLELIWEDLTCADDYVRYVRLGDFISNFFSHYAESICETEKIQKLLLYANKVERVNFTKEETQDMYDVYWSTFNDIDDIVIREEKKEGISERETYSIKDIKYLLSDRLQVELDCFEEDEDLYNKYVEEEKHSLYRKAEEVIWQVDYNYERDGFLETAFDLEKIKRKICNNTEEIIQELNKKGFIIHCDDCEYQYFYCEDYKEYENLDFVIEQLMENYQKRKAIYKVSFLNDEELTGLVVGFDNINHLIEYMMVWFGYTGSKNNFMRQVIIERIR